MNDRRVIILLVKYPQAGRVKTRLARTLGDEAAVNIYCQLVEHLIRMLRQVNVEEVRVCFDPAEKQNELESWLRPIWMEAGVSGNEAGLVFRPQCEGGLGERLDLAFGEVFQGNGEEGISRLLVVAIGGDCIEIDDLTFQATWQSLETKDVVFGPTADGGYYLVGMKMLHPTLFEKIPWSTEKTLEASLQQARDSGLKIGVLDQKHDIDTEEDWRRVEKKFPLVDSSESDNERS